MTDPRGDFDRLRAQWLRVLAQVRANAAALVAAEHDLRVRAARGGDPALAELAARLRAKREELEATIDALERRHADVATAFGVLADAYVAALIAEAGNQGFVAGPIKRRPCVFVSSSPP